MTNPHNQAQSDPEGPGVTGTEIRQARKLMETAYDMRLPKPDAARLAFLSKELASLEAHKPGMAIDDMASDLKEILAQNRTDDISEARALNEAESLLALAVLQEKNRIAGEMREIIIAHRPVPDEPSITNKTAELIKLRYGVSLPESQLDQVIQYLWRVLWKEEGLDCSLETCLDDLLRGLEKQQRQVSGAYHGLQEALDWTVKKLAGKHP